jgi:hypothetical protein
MIHPAADEVDQGDNQQRWGRHRGPSGDCTGHASDKVSDADDVQPHRAGRAPRDDHGFIQLLIG